MSSEQLIHKMKVEKAIRTSVYLSMGVAFVPLKVFSYVSLMTINLNLTHQLSDLYGVGFKKDNALKLIASAAGTSVSMLVTPALETLLNRIPAVGGFYAICSVPMMFGGCTYAVGRMFANHFERGGDFVNASTDKMKDDFKTAFQSSREWIGDKIKGDNAAQPESR